MCVYTEGQSAVVLNKGEGPCAEAPGHFRNTCKLTAEDSEGKMGLYEIELSPKAVTSPHLHHVLSEMFYMLEGEIEFLLGSQRMTARQGIFIAVPRETIHAFANLSARPAKFVVIFYPGMDRQAYFEGVANIIKNNPPNAKELKAALDAQFDNNRVPDVQFP